MSTPQENQTMSSLPPKPVPANRSGLGTALGAAALVIAIVALLLGAMLPAPGTTASPGPAPTLVSAVVGSDGSLDRGNQANTSAQVSTGVYHVFFDQYVWDCSWSVAIATTSTGQEPAGHATVSPLPVATYGISVSTYNASSSTLQNLSFHVIGSCPGGLWAKVGSDGTFQSGAGVTASVTQGSTGDYEVDFTQDVSNCAYIATLQNGGAGTVTTATRATNNFGVWVATFNTAGDPAQEAFSLSVYC